MTQVKDRQNLPNTPKRILLNTDNSYSRPLCSHRITCDDYFCQINDVKSLEQLLSMFLSYLKIQQETLPVNSPKRYNHEQGCLLLQS